MPKRKRGGDSSLHNILEKHEVEIFRALKKSKGFERQRLSKRTREVGVTPERIERLEREIVVLKSLDLHHIARVHLQSTLLKIKSIAASTNLPDELRRGVSKPELPAEEQAAFHNVTSALYGRDLVKQAIAQAIEEVRGALGVPDPANTRRPRNDGRRDTEEQPSDRKGKPLAENVSAAHISDVDESDESEFEGFGSDADEPGPVLGEPDSDVEGKELTELDKFNGRLGSSSDEDEDWDDDKYAQFRGKETVNLDDISLTGSGGESEAESEAESEPQIPSRSPSPPEKKTKKTKTAVAAVQSGARGTSTFLPSLMGGYISGSESASDIEEAKPKKRRGQRARRAIWEQKYGSSAKHLREASNQRGRDSGWDVRRGAVDRDDQGKRTPWKKGIRPSFSNNESRRESAPAPKVSKRDDEGALHPSWEARKKAKDSQKAVAFSGQKMVFD